MLLFCNCRQNSLLTRKYNRGSYFSYSKNNKTNSGFYTSETPQPQSSSNEIRKKQRYKFGIAAQNNGSVGSYIISGVSMTLTLAVLFMVAKLFGLVFPYVVIGVIVLVIGAMFLLVRAHLN
jgi:hypothetical protein